MTHLKRWSPALAALALLLLCPRIASAAVTATLSETSPNPAYGSCPMSIGFSGTISGTAGTKITYSWNRFINGVHTTPTGGTATLTGSPLLVTDSVPIQAGTTGTTFDQIWVHNIQNPPQSDVYSNKVTYSVTCIIPLPSGIHFVVVPPTPTGLTNTTDPPTCTNHAGFGGGLACLAGINAGMLALIWNWSPSASVKNVDEYKIYRIDGGQHTLVTTQNAKLDDGSVATMALLDKPADGFNGKCYVVTAFKSGGESTDSQYFCAGNYQGGPIVESFTLVPTNVRTVYHHYSYTGVGPGCGLSNTGTQPIPGWWVGFIHNYVSSAGFTCGQDTWVYQTAAAFNLGAPGIILRSPKAVVKSANLLFKRIDTNTNGCIEGVNLPTGDWSNAQDLIPNNNFVDGLPWNQSGINFSNGQARISGPNYSIDVSTAVSNWAKGVWSNNGFLLIGGNEDTSGYHDNNVCNAQVSGFALAIQVQINP